MLGHPNLKNILVFTRGVEGVPKKCGKQESTAAVKLNAHEASD
jgi:hypothetical protein